MCTKRGMHASREFFQVILGIIFFLTYSGRDAQRFGTHIQYVYACHSCNRTKILWSLTRIYIVYTDFIIIRIIIIIIYWCDFYFVQSYLFYMCGYVNNFFTHINGKSKIKIYYFKSNFPLLIRWLKLNLPHNIKNYYYTILTYKFDCTLYMWSRWCLLTGAVSSNVYFSFYSYVI